MVRIKEKKILGKQEYLILEGVTGKTLIAPLAKKYKGEVRIIGGKVTIVRPLK